MVKILEIKKLRKDILEYSSNYSKEIVCNLDQNNKDFLFPDITYKDEFFSNNFSRLNNNYNIIIKSDSEIEVCGKGTLNIEVNSNCKILFNFKDDCFVQINLLIKKECDVEIYELSSNKDIYKNLFIYQEENSKVIFNQALFSSRFNSTTSFLEKEASFYSNSGYYISNVECYHNVKSVHIGKDSFSDLNIKGAVMNNSKIISDGLVRIEGNASGSQGYQKLFGLILDDNSKISSEPILEISNNDVKCSHGASISQIPYQTYFYLTSRGLSREQAKNLYIRGFFKGFEESYGNLLVNYF